MKRIIPAFLLCAVLTGCVEYYDDEPEICTETTEEAMSETCEILQEIAETCSEQMTSETAEFSEIQEITAIEEIEFIEYEYEEQEPEFLEIPEEITPETTVFMTEETTEIQTESVIEFMTETETLPEISEAEPVSETETESESDKEPETEPELSDLEKAQIIYEYMLENGHGTCVNYACQTYEKCLEIGLPCYIVWTDAGLYGHVANTVCVNEIWFVLDTQAGGFLESNYGFTEVVNLDCEHIADGEMLSDYSYQELFE
ncbi:MAG: hypothetical protein IKP69_10280 [Oscillospiraceae bacterium]|nr:hypothetical protein [Oscillospiraceae bacterium]